MRQFFPLVRPSVLISSLVLLLSAGIAPVVAQEATPMPGLPTGGLPVAASGLTNPRGFTWGPDGTLYVALAGTGGSNPPTEQAPTVEQLGWIGGRTGAVVRIEGGCPVAVATGLPSARDVMGSVLGVDDVAFLGGQLYAAVDGGGAAHGNPDQPAGVYRINMDGSYEVVADLSAWVRANPVANVPEDYDPDAEAYRLLADEAAGRLWVIGPNSGQVLSVTPDGTITRVADLSAGHPVPDAIAPAPDGGVYVGNLTAVPFADGSAKVIHVAPDGTTQDVWTGLTTVTDIAVGPDGTLYATELSTGNLQEPPFLVPGSGRVVRQTGPDSLEVVAGGLMLPVAMDFGPDGLLYVALPAIGADHGEGVLVTVDVAAGMASPAASAAPAPACTPVPETIAPAGAATPVASPAT